MADADSPMLESFMCPILKQPMQDPVCTSDGHCYERSAILAWFASQGNKRPVSPITNLPLPSTEVQANEPLRRAIQEFMTLFQPNGTQEVKLNYQSGAAKGTEAAVAPTAPSDKDTGTASAPTALAPAAVAAPAASFLSKKAATSAASPAFTAGPTEVDNKFNHVTLHDVVTWSSGNLALPEGAVGNVISHAENGMLGVDFRSGVHYIHRRYLKTVGRQSAFRIGDLVTWTGADDDVPFGSVGTVTDFGQRGRLFVHFRSGRTFSFKPEELRMATPGPPDLPSPPTSHQVRPTTSPKDAALRAGDRVMWVGADEDVPAGSVGEVLGVMFPGRTCVRFPSGKYNFKPEQLRPANVDSLFRPGELVQWCGAEGVEGAVGEVSSVNGQRVVVNFPLGSFVVHVTELRAVDADLPSIRPESLGTANGDGKSSVGLHVPGGGLGGRFRRPRRSRGATR